MADSAEQQTTSSADQQTFNNELRGVLFRNDKGDNPNRPDYRGRTVVEGKGYRISAWKRTAKQSNQPFLSLQLTRDETLDEATQGPAAAADDIGF